MNKVDERAKDRTPPSSVKKPYLKMDNVVPMQVEPKSDLCVQEKKNSDPESDSEQGSEESESSEESDAEIPDDREKPKENFRTVYMKFHQDIGISINCC